jgi:fructose-bisphosphate aldolase, class II
VVKFSHAIGVTVEAELGCLGSLETGQAGEEDGHGAEGSLDHSMLLTDPDQAADFVSKTEVRRARDRDRHQPRRLQVHPQADRRHSRDRAHQGDSRPHSEHPPGHARLVLGAAGPARGHPPVRRRHEGNLRRAGRGDPDRDPARRAQDQHRHRHPPGDDRRGAQVPRENPSKFDPREFNKPAREAAREICLQRYRQFGCEGQGSKVQGVPLNTMIERYRSGELAQVVA